MLCDDSTSVTQRLYIDAFKAGLKPDPDYTLAQWANEHRRLSQKGSAEPGPYRIERTPFWVEVAECLSTSSPIQRVIVMKSAQVGFSELGFNFIGYVMHAVPGPMMMVQPTTELAEKVSKQRIASMIEETPVLREIIGPEKSRTTGQTVLLKEFRGGVLSIVGANSPVGMRSMPVRFLFGDEVSSWPMDIGGEGSGVKLSEARTQTFKRRKVLFGSTPTVVDECQIEAEYLKTDQRRYFVPCPFCGAMQWLKWRQIKWVDNDPKTARYECEHCHELIEERHKTEMLAQGQWQATAPGDDITRGYHISALYSPVGWKSWAEIVQEFLEAKQDAPRLKTWTNTVLGETWSDGLAAKVGAHELLERRDDYAMGIAPKGVLIAVGGVDVQDNRLTCSIYGIGREEEDWLINRQEIFGDPSKPEVWKQLTDILTRPIPHETHEDIRVKIAGIDSGGHHTHEVYQYTREMRAKGFEFLALKGSSQKGKAAISKPSKVDVNFKGQVLKGGAEVHMVGTDTIKSVIYGRLKHNEPGPGYPHFPIDADEDFFNQLTAETKKTRYVRGFPVTEWVKKAGARNEALDEKVYAYAVLQLFLMRYNRATVWDQLEKKLVPKADSSAEKPRQDKPEQVKIKPIRRGFVNNW